MKQFLFAICFFTALFSYGQWGNGTLNTTLQTTGGNVGIGTAASPRRLYVLEPNSFGSDAHFKFEATNSGGGNNANVFEVYSGRGNGFSGNIFNVYSAGGDKFIIKGNGFSGFGTNSPEAKLEVYSGDVVIGGQYKKFMLTADWQNSSANSLQIVPKNNGVFDYGKAITFRDNGELEVVTNVILGGSYQQFMIHNQFWDPSSNALIFAPKLNGSWDFTKSMVYRNTGNLEVNGTIYAKEVQVMLPPFPDYVFSKKYNLMSLSSLENYIDQNGHLPNLPSAEEIDENGIGLGDLVHKQMEKIEELTLYVIALNKKIEKLEKENKCLRNN